MVRGYQVLDKFLQLLPVHLQQRLADGDSHRDGGRVPYPVDCQRHHVQAPEDVAAAAAAGHTRDLAPVEYHSVSIRYYLITPATIPPALLLYCVVCGTVISHSVFRRPSFSI